MALWSIQGLVCRMLCPYRGNILLGNLLNPDLAFLGLKERFEDGNPMFWLS